MSRLYQEGDEIGTPAEYNGEEGKSIENFDQEA
jgi:hypothetical protein